MSVPPLSALECGVCLTLVCQPVSLSCGHTFCRVCLIKTLRINKRCPTCRAVCHTSAEDQPEDVMIAEIVRRCFPELAERRRREAVEDRNNLTEVLPIFYYHMPMFPGETVSLRLYEPRYKLMMQRIMHTSRRFAYVPSRSSYRANIGDVALVAEVRDFDLRDGKELIAVKLASRVTVMCHFIEEGTQGLHYCRVKTKTDEVPPAGSTLAAETVELAERTRNLIHGTVEPIRSHLQNVRGDIPRNPESLSMWIAAFLPFSSMEKYALLHETSTVARLLACEPHLVSLGGNAPRDSFPRTAAPAVSESHEHRLDGSDSAEEVYPSTPSSEER